MRFDIFRRRAPRRPPVASTIPAPPPSPPKRHTPATASSAFGVFKRMYREGDRHGHASRALFDILMEAKRYAAARPLAARLVHRAPPSGSLAWRLAELALVNRDLAAAFAVLDLDPSSTDSELVQYRAVAQSLRAEEAAGDTMAGYRHLAIAGVAFCGSTALGVILGSLPGLAFAGETHWLANVRAPGNVLESIRETKVPPLFWPIACRVCNRDCAAFTIEFRRALAADPTGWYGKIADRLGVKTLVTSDKNPPLYWQHDPLFRMDYIILYKSPNNFIQSMLKHRRIDVDEPPSIGWVNAKLKNWANAYWDHLKIPRPTGRRIVLSWERFAAEPIRHLQQLCHLLNLPPPSPDVLGAIKLGHFIGGNAGVDVAELARNPILALEPHLSDLDPDVEAMVAAHDQSRRIARMLDAEHRRLFAPERGG